MAARRSTRRIYRQIGVFLPLERESDDPAIDPLQRVMQDAVVPAGDNAMDAGFLYVQGTQLGSWGKFRTDDGSRIDAMKSLLIVQSASTGELFFNKIIERPWDAAAQNSQPPLELRCSTYPHRIGDPTIDVGPNVAVGPYGIVRKGALPDVPYFNKLRFWQELDQGNADPHPVTVFSLYFDLCNGGPLSALINEYQVRQRAIPESFIWHVAEQLFLALVTLRFGTYTVQDARGRETTTQIPNWTHIYHRDLHANNVFINYIPKGPGRVPRVGLANNAFPEIVVGDFGNSGVEGDDPATLPVPVFPPSGNDDEDDVGHLFRWEDIYSVGEILRDMAMAHSATGHLSDRPNSLRMDDVNQEPTAPPYSDDLINLLKRFEFHDMENTTVRDIGDNAAISAAFPSPQTVRNTLLPQAKGKVVGYLDPAGKAAGYFDTIDVSWTRPAELMPFSYIMRYATDAGDGPDGGPPPPDGGSNSGSDSGPSTGSIPRFAPRDDGDGDGDGDVHMPDSPSPSGSAHDGDDQPGSQAGSGGTGASSASPSPPPLPADQLAMQNLSKMHKWNDAKPRYELRTLEYAAPTILPLTGPP